MSPLNAESLDLLRGAIAAAAIFSTLVSVGVLLYSRMDLAGNSTEAVLARAFRKLVVLNLVALVILSAAYLVRFFFAMPQPRLSPDYVFYVDSLTYFVGVFHIVFPALILWAAVSRIKRGRKRGPR